MAEEQANKPDPVKAAQAITNGAPINTALLEAGYSKWAAKRGRKALNREILAALAQEGHELAEIGATLTKKQVEDTIAGTLYSNMLSGESKGNDAAKLLGSMEKYSVFRNESNQNLIVLADIRQEQFAPDHVLTSQPVTQYNSADVE